MVGPFGTGFPGTIPTEEFTESIQVQDLGEFEVNPDFLQQAFNLSKEILQEGTRFSPANVIQSIETRKAVYGRTRVPGIVVFANKPTTVSFMHAVLVFATHEIDSFDEIWIDDFEITPLDSNGEPPVDNDLNGWVIIKKHLGTDNQTVDTDLQNALFSVGDWVTESKTPTRVSNTQFKISGDETANYPADTFVEIIETNSTFEGVVTSSSYDSGADETTVTISATENISTSLKGVARDTGDKIWDDSHRLRGIAYLYVKIALQHSKFPNATLPNINAVIKGKPVQDPRTTSAGKVWQVDDSAGSFTDETTDFNNNTDADFQPFPSSEATDDYVAIGLSTKFAMVEFDNANGTAGVGGTVAWEYWDGSAWSSLSGVKDETNGFTATASDGQQLSFDVPVDWTARTLNGSSSLYFIRARVTGTYSTNPVYDQGFIRNKVAYSNNPALAVMDYLRDERYGLKFPLSSIDLDSFAQAADDCDTQGYEIAAIVDSKEDPNSIVQKMLDTMAGNLMLTGEKWQLKVGIFNSPALTFSEEDLIEPPKIRLRRPRRQLFNTVRGTYRPEERNFNNTDIESVSSTAFVNEDDGIEIFTDKNLPYVEDVSAARRLLSIELENNRRQRSASIATSLKGLRVRAGDIITFDYNRTSQGGTIGWADGTFDFLITSHKLVIEEDQNGHPLLVVRMELQQIDSSVFSAPSATAPSDLPTIQPNPNEIFHIKKIEKEVVTPAGLELVNRLGDVTSKRVQFIGKDIQWQWRGVSESYSFEIGQEPGGSGAGREDLDFQDFQVTIEDEDGTERRVEFVREPTYTYTIEKNQKDSEKLFRDRILDHTRPLRTVVIDVRSRRTTGELSEFGARMKVNNEAPDAPEDPDLEAATFVNGVGIVQVKWPGSSVVSNTTFKTATDIKGTAIFASREGPNFTPDATTAIGAAPYPHDQWRFNAQPGTTYYVKIAYFDGFGLSGVKVSDASDVDVPGFQASTGGGSISWDVGAEPYKEITLQSTAKLTNPVRVITKTSGSTGSLSTDLGPTNSETYSLIIKQDGTGGHTMGFDTRYYFPDSIQPTLSSAAGAIDIIHFVSDGTFMYGVGQLSFGN